MLYIADHLAWISPNRGILPLIGMCYQHTSLHVKDDLQQCLQIESVVPTFTENSLPLLWVSQSVVFRQLVGSVTTDQNSMYMTWNRITYIYKYLHQGVVV